VNLLALNVIENPHVTDPEPILRMAHLPKALDAALTDLGRLVPQVHLDRVANFRAFELR
jgi:hypothetical protein